MGRMPSSDTLMSHMAGGPTTTRLLAAAAIGALAAVLVLLAALWVMGIAAGAKAAAATRDVFGHFSQFVLFFVWPALFALCALLLLSSYPLIRKRPGSQRRVLLIGGGAGVGAILAPVVWAAFWGAADNVVVWSLIGATGGAVAGLCSHWVAK